MRREASVERVSGVGKQERKEMGERAKSCSPLSPPFSKESEEEGGLAEGEGLRVGQLKLLPSRRDVKIEIFACFVCFGEGIEEWLWESEGVYLAHMRRKH